MAIPEIRTVTNLPIVPRVPAPIRVRKKSSAQESQRKFQSSTKKWRFQSLKKALDAQTVAEGQNASTVRPQTQSPELVLSRIVSDVQADPFNSWPVSWNRDIDANFQFLIKCFGPSMFGYLPNNDGFDIFKTQAKLALTDPAAFHSLMIISTQRKDQLAGQTLLGMNNLWHKVEATRLIKERLEGGDISKCIDAGTIYAVMCCVGISAQWNAVEMHEFSASALEKLIIQRGGLKDISETDPVLETSLFGMAVINPGLFRSDLYTIPNPDLLEQPQDGRVLLYSLLGFVRATDGLSEKMPETMARIQAVFGPGTAAFGLLSYTPDMPGILDDRQKRLQMRLQAHICLYVFSLLIYASAFQVQEFLHHLDYVHAHVNVWRNSLRMFAWALVCNIQKGSLMFSMQAWQSYEMLCSGFHVADELKKKLLQYLLALLTGRTQQPKAMDDLMSEIRAVMFMSSSDTDSHESPTKWETICMGTRVL